MDRRSFLKAFALGTVVGKTGLILPAQADDTSFADPDENTELDLNAEIDEQYIKDYLDKIHNYDKVHKDDVFVKPKDLRTLRSTVLRLQKVQNYVGPANFALLSFDACVRSAANVSRIGEFSDAEKEFMESVFYTNAKDYGFFGEKPVDKLTSAVTRDDVEKIPGTGNYLIRGAPIKLYNKIRRDIGGSVILTSGVRGVIKQMHLFLTKTIASGGNFSMASRSLAPPGHSFHGVGDFDVGKVGWGARNFTEYFADTMEYKRLTDMGFIKIRYPEDNFLGVRFEPWHIKTNNV
ncbi:MAG: M15 family metallopeptidase [Gammaproteobacteria bacterium]|nr:M15 family metallopeptidase [Gammaproteobacteria bacterium]